MFELNRVSAAALLALGGVAADVAIAQEQLERVEVTGSAIKRINAETPSPLEVVSRKDIERSGASTINELIKSIPAIDIQDAGEISSNSPGGSGTARVRMRGLGDSQTLVLVNGRRVPVNPLADASGAGAAFNVNQIPVSAIDRVEILKDGGSAIYGADAVAGVVNFVLRKDYQGIIGTVNYGTSSRGDADETGVTAVAGYGDLARDRFNLLVAIDGLKRDPILRKDREISRTMDFRRYGPIPGFNLDGRSSFAPEGNILTAAGAISGQTVRPCPPENFTGGACRYDPNSSLLTAYNGADRISGLVAATAQLSPDFQATARFMGSEQKDHFEAHPVPDNFFLPDGRRYAGRFMQGGPRITDKKSTFNNLDLGIEGTVGNYDVKVGYSRGEAKATNRDSNYYELTPWRKALTEGLIDATSLKNDQALVDSLKVSPVRTASSKLDFFDAQVSGDLFKLPGGMSRFAVGINVWKETLKDTPDQKQILGQVVGSIQQSAVAADRDAKAVFGELALPLLKDVEVQLAIRRDDYDTASRSSPKVAVKWNALPQLMLRASYSESFKMPTLKQQFANAGQGAINLTESECVSLGFAPGCAGQPAFRLTGSNPDLKPETGKSYNIGAVADLGPVSLGLDFWQIDKENNIDTPTLQKAIDQGFTRFDAATSRWFIFQNLQNFAVSKNSGVDFDGRLSLKKTPVGNVTLRAAASYYTDQKRRQGANDPWEDFNGTYNTPRWRSVTSITSEYGPWTVQALVRGTGGFWDTVQPWQNFKLLPAGGLRRVRAYDETDLTVSYSGFKNLTLSGAVKNLFDRMPPFSATNATNNNYSQQGFAELYTSRGRYFQVTARYQFQ